MKRLGQSLALAFTIILSSQAAFGQGTVAGGGSILKKFQSYIEDNEIEIADAPYVVIPNDLFIELLGYLPKTQEQLDKQVNSKLDFTIYTFFITKNIPVLQLLDNKEKTLVFVISEVSQSHIDDQAELYEHFLNEIARQDIAYPLDKTTPPE